MIASVGLMIVGVVALLEADVAGGVKGRLLA